jgi:hypothetical protein
MLVDSGIAHLVIQFNEGTNGLTKLTFGFLKLGAVLGMSTKLVVNLIQLGFGQIHEVDDDSKSEAHVVSFRLLF